MNALIAAVILAAAFASWLHSVDRLMPLLGSWGLA